ncbi:unnamed protein product, partial [Symbiodinium necroappetens]
MERADHALNVVKTEKDEQEAEMEVECQELFTELMADGMNGGAISLSSSDSALVYGSESWLREDINRIVQRGKADPKKYMRWHTFKVDTPTYFVEKKIEGHYKERATASSKQSQELEVWGGPGDSGMSMNVDHVMLQPQGAADMNSEENMKEAAKVLKKMGFPNMETPANPGTSLPKILTCLDRRLAIISETQTELENHKKTLKEKGKLTTTLERMDAKLTELYNAIEQKSNEFEDLRMTGVVE